MAILDDTRAALERDARTAARLLRNVRSLADMTAETASAHDFDTTARRLLLTLLGALSATRGVIWLYDAEKDALATAATRGLADENGALALPPAAAQALREMALPFPLEDLDEPHAPEIAVAIQ